MGFLTDRGWLEPAQPPLARVARPRLRAYFRALRAAGNADWTIIGRFGELVMALKILAPGEDVSWVLYSYSVRRWSSGGICSPS